MTLWTLPATQPLMSDVTRVHRIVLLFDAGGLAMCAVVGTQKALAHDVAPVAAALLGMLT